MCLKVKGQTLASTAQLSDFLYDRIAWRSNEVFVVVFLDAKSRVVWAGEMFRGTRDLVNISIREIACAAYRHAAHSIVVSHNHPMGDPTPSERDCHVTRRLRLVMAMAGVPLRDHIIIAENATHSMAEQGPWYSPLEEWAALLDDAADPEARL